MPPPCVILSPSKDQPRNLERLDNSRLCVRPRTVSPPDPLELLYDEHAAALFRFLLRLTRNEAEVKDILQEIFIRLARSPDLLTNVRTPLTFLFRMAHRLVIDRVRRSETRDRYARLADDEQSTHGTSAVVNLDADWQRRKLAESLAAIPSDQRAVILLKVWENLTFAEIAEALDIPPDTAASRYRYALDKLRHALRPLHGDLR